MSKSVLVIDTPDSCRECNFRKYNEFGRCYVCAAKNNYMIDRDADIDQKQSWCPLSPLPKKIDLDKYFMRGDCKSMTHMVMNIRDRGWNECIDEILKGQNNEKTN